MPNRRPGCHRPRYLLIATSAFLALISSLIGCPPAAPPQVLFVNAASAGGNGESWATAYRDLQEALTRAAETESVREIWVAAGVYRPARPDGDRTATFQLLDNVAIYGGFVGSENTRDERDPAANETILSGDLAGDDDGTLNRGENVYHVVTGSGADATAVLDGFTIRGGNANAAGASSGGGMLIDGGSPTIVNCRFEQNSALTSGGGMLVLDGQPAIRSCRFEGNLATSNGGGLSCVNADPTITDCVFEDNVSSGNGGGLVTANSRPVLTGCTFAGNSAASGGAAYNGDRSAPRFVRCTFRSNASESDGGAVANVVDVLAEFEECVFEGNVAARSGGALGNSIDSDVLVVNARFVGNSASGSGGAILNFSSRPVLVNCAFSGNTAALGGAVANRQGADAVLINCTLAGNSATSGGAVYNSFESSPVLTNCILWENSEVGGQVNVLQMRTESGDPVVNFSCIQGGWDGAGGEAIIDDDPLFVDAAGADSAFGTPDDDLRLRAESPCIDAGTVRVDTRPAQPGDQRLPASDLDGAPRVADGNGDDAARVDVGAYEFQPD